MSHVVVFKESFFLGTLVRDIRQDTALEVEAATKVCILPLEPLLPQPETHLGEVITDLMSVLPGAYQTRLSYSMVSLYNILNICTLWKRHY